MSGQITDFQPGPISLDSAAAPAAPSAASPALAPRSPANASQLSANPHAEFTAALTRRESSGDPNALSVQGARGARQIMRDTFNDYAQPGESYDNEADRVAASDRKIAADFTHYNGDYRKVAAAYIGGRGAVDVDGNINDRVRDKLGTTPKAYADSIMARMPKSGSGGGTGATPTAETQPTVDKTGVLSNVVWDSPTPVEQPKESPSLLADTGNLLGQGAAQTAGAVAWIANKLTDGKSDAFAEQHLGRGFSDMAQDAADHYLQKMSPEMRAASEKEWISSRADETFGSAWSDPHAYWSGVVNSLPATIATMGPAGWSAKLAAGIGYKAAIAKAAALGVPAQAAIQAAEKTAVKAATYTAMATGGAGEGLIGGGMQGQQVEEQIMKLPDNMLMQAEPYRKALAIARSKGMNEQAAKDYAKKAVATDASVQTAWRVGLATAMLGIGFDGYVGSQVAKVMNKGGSGATRMKEGLHGAMIEVPTEFTQGFAEQFLGNQAVKEHANPNQDLMEGVANNAVGSAVAAAPTGFGFGFATGGGHEQPAAMPPPIGNPPAPSENGPGTPPASENGPEAPPVQPGATAQPTTTPAAPDMPTEAATAAAPAPIRDSRNANTEQPVEGAATAPTTAEQVEQAASFTDTNASAADKKAGKYMKGVVNLHGLEVHIENPKGDERSGTDAGGHKWSVTMANHYGEIEGTTGADGDKVDVFIGPHPEMGAVYVVNQLDPKTGEFDEHKVMMGFDSQAAARNAYLRNYEKGWKGLGSITAMSVDQLRERLPEFSKQEAIKRRTKPAAVPETTDKPAAPQGGNQQPAEAAAPAPVQKTAPFTNREQPAEVNANSPPVAAKAESKPQVATERDSRLEAVAKVYDAIGDDKKAAGIRARIAKSPAVGERLDALESVAATAKRTFDNRQKETQQPAQKPAPEAAKKTAEKPAAPTNQEPAPAPEPANKPADPESEQTQQPVEKTDKEKAQDDLDQALSDIGAIFGRAVGVKNVAPSADDEKKLIPALTFLMDSAFRLGYHKFKAAAKFALDTIRAKLGIDVANSITLDHLQGAYIGMAGKYQDKGASTKKEVVAVEHIAEITGENDEPKPSDTAKPDDARGAPLANAPTENVPPAESKRDSGPRTTGGSKPDATGDERRPDSGVPSPRSVGNGTRELAPAEGRTEPRQRTDADRPAPARDGGEKPKPPEGSGGLKPGAPFPVATNFVITDELELGKGTPVEKYNGNVAAIRLLKQIEAEHRTATPDEQKILARYVGWGGLKQAFPKPGNPVAKGWEGRVKELKDLLSEANEYEAAARSILDSHYTSKTVIDGIWNIARRLGFDGGKVLEDSMGVGNFFGLMPKDLREHAPLTGVEQDSITARIAKQLYPNARILGPIGFHQVEMADQSFNLSVGNPPFGSQSLHDPSAKHFKGWSIHNFFFGKAIDKLAAGGLHIQVVSRFLMDKDDATTRDYLAHRTELVGAIRLPWTAFNENASTKVITDIVILKKLPESAWGTANKQWTKTVFIPDPLGGEPMRVSQYFAEHPEMVLGTMDRSGEQFEGDINVNPHPDETVAAGLERVLSTLPTGIYQRNANDIKPQTDASAPSDEIEKYSVGSFFEHDGKVHRSVLAADGTVQSEEITADTQWGEKTKWGEIRIDRLRGMIGLRETTVALLAAEAGGEPHEELMAELNKRYDAFVKNHGYLNEAPNERTFRGDDLAPLLLALEHNFYAGMSKTRADKLGVVPSKPSADKAPIFSQIVNGAHVAPTSADNPVDGLDISISEKGIVSIPYIASLTGKSEAEVIDALTKGDKPAIYFDPASDTYKLVSEYLGGNVKRKYKEALDAGLTDQADALRAVFPVDVKSGDLRARAGTPWVDSEAYQEFVKHIIGDNAKSKIKYIQATGGFAVSIEGGDPALKNVRWGTPDRDAVDIFTRIMNSKDLTIRRKDANGNQFVDVEATQAALDKADEIRNEFETWIFKDADRRERLVKHYNDNYNTTIDSKVDGSYLENGLPGKVPNDVIGLRRHQLNAVARIIRNGKALLDHVVGAGKTFTIVAAAMEQKRLGLARKPMVVVPNHLVAQWSTDFYRLYPGAKILAMSKDDFAKTHRRRMLAKIATGNYDAIIFSHSSFGFIDNDIEIKKEFIDKQIFEIQAAIDMATETEGKKSRTAAQYQRTKEKLENRLQEILDAPKDDLLTFQELGVDMLYIDESQEFKNLFFTTQKQGVGGFGNPTGSKKASDLFIKSQWLQRVNDGRGVTFATGTPISNSLTELFTLQRYLGADELESRGLSSLDAWLSAFGVIESNYESNVTGTKYKRKERLRRLTNVPEIMQLYKQFADSVTLEQIKQNYRNDHNGAEFPVPKVKGNKPRNNIVVPRSNEQAAYSATLQERMEKLTRGSKDNALAILGDGRKAALDMRLVDRSATDHDGSKSHIASDEITRIYNENTHRNGTQLVFLDLSTPVKHGRKDADRYLKEAREILGNKNAAPYGNYGKMWSILNGMLTEMSDGVDENTAAGAGVIDKIEKFLEQSAEIEAAMTTADTGFSVYDDMRSKLIERGVPGGEIAFIHDYNGDSKKQELFDMVNAGKIRVLLGSTAKMGAGTNVQQRLVALHHMDCPWRPSDIEQREGRGIRQGNLFRLEDPNFEIEINAYATEGTSDVFFWQIQEQKLIGINSLRNFKGEREIEEVSADAMSAAEMKALASGNPLILEDVTLTEQVRKMEVQKRRHSANQQDLDSEIRKYKKWIATLPAEIEREKAFDEKVRAYEADPFNGKRPTADVDGKQMNATEATDHVRAIEAAADQKAYSENTPHREALRVLEEKGKAAKSQTARKAAEDEYDELLKQGKKSEWSVTIDDKKHTSNNSARHAIAEKLGDSSPINIVINDKDTISRHAIADVLEPIVTGLSRGGEKVTFGTIAGMDITLEWQKTTFQRGVLVTIGDQSTLVDEREIRTNGAADILPVTATRVIKGITQTLDKNRQELFQNQHNLKQATTGLKPLEEQTGGVWGKDEELAAKKARLSAVRKELAGETPSPDATPGPGVASLTDARVPEAGWISAAKISEIVENRIGQFAHQPPVHIVDRASDIAQKFSGEPIAGAVYNGRIYLVREGLRNNVEVGQVLWHELFHYGMRRFMDKKQYIAALTDLYSRDAWIRESADKWAASSEGVALRKSGASEDYITARGADEAIAELAKKNAGDFSNNSLLYKAARAIARWIATLADRFGFNATAQKWRSATNDDARNLIREVFGKLREGAPGTDRAGDYADPAFATASADNNFAESPIYARMLELGHAMAKSDSNVSLWHRTVGTMFDMAKRNPTFRKVFDKGQDFLADIWRFASAANSAAPTWFKSGYFKGINRTDANAATQYLLRGTLADNVWTDKQLRDGITLDNGPGEPKTKLAGLTDNQVKMYHEALAAVRIGLENQAKGFISRAVRKQGIVINKSAGLDEFVDSVIDQLNQQADFNTGLAKQLAKDKPAEWERQVKELNTRATTAKATISHVIKLQADVTKLAAEGYFPLSRFGMHFVAVYLTPDDKEAGKAAYFALHESNTAANLDVNKMAKKYPKDKNANAIIENGQLSKSSFQIYDGLNLDALELFMKEVGMDMDAGMQQAYQQLFSSRSSMKRMLHRKGTAGYSEDGYRILADFIMTTSRGTAAAYNFPEMMDAVKQTHGDVRDHAQRLFDYLKDPVEEAHKLRGYMFFHFLGGSLSAALVNLTQTPMVTAPFLATYETPAATAARLTGAGKDALQDPLARGADGEYLLKGRMWDDVRKATNDGTLAAQEGYQMMGVASGSKLAGNKYSETFLKAWGSMFSYAETMNRRMAYIAAHRIATEQGMNKINATALKNDPHAKQFDNAHDFAENAVKETQYIYNKGNRPVWSRGPIGSTLFTFKQFSINTLELMARLPLQQKIYMLIILMLMAGVEGLPFAEDLEDLIDTIGQRFPETGVTTNSKKWLDRHAKDLFGQFLGKAFVQGLPSAGMGFDASKRFGLGNLIPGSAALKVSETDKMRDVRDMFGAVAGLAYAAAGASEDLLRGNVAAAAKKALPTAAGNVLKGGEMLTKGEARDAHGNFTTKITPLEAAGKMIGLNPNAIADKQRIMDKVSNDESYIAVTKAALVDQYINALVNNQQDDLIRINKQIMDWNKAHPELPIVMTPKAIRERMRLAMMDADTRQLKRAPKPLRAEIARSQRE